MDTSLFSFVVTLHQTTLLNMILTILPLTSPNVLSVKLESFVSSRAVSSELTTPGARPVVVAPENSSSHNYDMLVVAEANSFQNQNPYLSTWPFSTVMSVNLALVKEL